LNLVKYGQLNKLIFLTKKYVWTNMYEFQMAVANHTQDLRPNRQGGGSGFEFSESE